MAVTLALAGPQMAPSTCVSCGAGNTFKPDERQWFDMGFSIDYYGRVYCCSQCFTEGINLLGYGDVSTYKARIVELEQEVVGDDNSRRVLRDIADLIGSLPVDPLEVNSESADGTSGSEESPAESQPERVHDPKSSLAAIN